jgi:hypothetical protein
MTASTLMAPGTQSSLSVGDWVEVRSVEEILATLDESGALDGLPFMPEMLQYCGRQFRVGKSAHKTCDTIERYVIRRVDGTVHLEGLRCDGSGHDGCQASCLIFWKEVWLRPVPGPGQGVVSRMDNSAIFERLQRAGRVGGSDAGLPIYRCQATDLLKFSTNVRRRERWDPRFYIRDVTSGNVKLGKLLWYGTGAAINAFLRKWFGFRLPRLRGLAIGQTPTSNESIQAGEFVRVRPKEEIMQTLNPQLRNRGMWFDGEMVPYCNSTFRVIRRVERLVDEKTGRMITLAHPALILDGVICSGHNAIDRMFCPREIYPYWREVWVQRVGNESADRS